MMIGRENDERDYETYSFDWQDSNMVSNIVKGEYVKPPFVCIRSI